MGEVVNLRLMRKRKVRADKERLAEENRARHGRTRADREAERLNKAFGTARLEAHRRADKDEG
ncbi:DUF4169 family protein [Chelativorans sp. AA-79]|uniref:DUF4169 family protein n=1 Tax=Chelativorans sp. AA-79 TaxID=3028735 RepID=UPI0023F7C53F|nr:DUF4169 family protein [Chelativorans sp. AA-79]WEX11374.1 DUF4169 family protein [Chelativorans sp. AA-79]